MSLDTVSHLNKLPTPLDSIENTSQESLLTLEEQRREVIESAQVGRMHLLKGVLNRVTSYVDDNLHPAVKKTTKSVLGFTVVGNIERGKVALLGKDLSGERVTNQERILAGLVVASSILFYGLVGYGTAAGSTDALHASGVVYTGSIPLLLAQMTPKLMTNARTVAELSGNQKILNFLDKTESLFSRVGYGKIQNMASLYESEEDVPLYV